MASCADSYGIMPAISKVPCSSAVRSARAVIEEVPEAASSSVINLARCSVNHSERDVHKMTSRCGLTLPLHISELIAYADEKIPVVMLSEWCKSLLSKNLWSSLSGLDQPCEERSSAQWELFWQRYKTICPSHPVFEKSPKELKHTAASLLHGDAGRSKKKTAVMILSCHSVLGRGCKAGYDESRCEKFAKQELNYAGHTWSTRWLLSVLPRSLYDDARSGNFQLVLNALVSDMLQLFHNGLVSPLSGQRHYFVIINVMGDWPFLKKAFGLCRTFENAAKQASSRAEPKGICHICLADKPGYPWEDFQSPAPKWRTTYNLEPAWSPDMPLMRLPHDATDPAHFPGQASTPGTSVLGRYTCLRALLSCRTGFLVDPLFQGLKQCLTT